MKKIMNVTLAVTVLAVVFSIICMNNRPSPRRYLAFSFMEVMRIIAVDREAVCFTAEVLQDVSVPEGKWLVVRRERKDNPGKYVYLGLAAGDKVKRHDLIKCYYTRAAAEAELQRVCLSQSYTGMVAYAFHR